MRTQSHLRLISVTALLLCHNGCSKQAPVSCELKVGKSTATATKTPKSAKSPKAAKAGTSPKAPKAGSIHKAPKAGSISKEPNSGTLP